EGLIGLFVNTLAVRTDLSGDPTFQQLVGRVHETALGAFAHQELPFEKLVEVLQPSRHLNVPPLFQVMFVLQNAPLPPVQLPGLLMHAQPVDSGAARFDLTLIAAEDPKGLRLTAEYSTDLFDERTVARLLAHFHTLLQGVAARPEARLSELPLMDEAERHQVLLGWNNTRSDYPRDATIHALFQAQARLTPDAVALVSGAEHLTYRQLDERANQLAHHLRSLGVASGTPVAVGLERSFELIICLLGILKAGGAYVPLETAYPRERLALLLEDSGAALLLTNSRLASRLPPFSGRTVLLDAESTLLARQPTHAPESPTQALGLAYVMFTSGSTGRPKGVMVPHRGVVRLV
ncbi:AMP-binding protein, partial [Pyxidicoccus caerfyrddinensis]|uniref:AMP-binding protein n=1 Tax=Pyxidicoccus caerfyrddinensis TaxID=2709663 RepID=UPI0013DC925A